MGGRVRAEAAPSQAIKVFSELLCCRTAAKHSQPARAAARGHRGAPNQQWGVVLLQCSPALLFQPQLSSSCALQSSADNRAVRSP